MRAFTSLLLACSWENTARYLSRRWIKALTPLVDRQDSSIMGAWLRFDRQDPLLEDFLAVASQTMISDPRDGSFLNQIGFKRGGGPLLRMVRRWNDYDFTDLRNEAVVQLQPARAVELVMPLAQYYHLRIEPTPNCSACGRAVLTQQRPLRVRADFETGIFLRADTWHPDDSLAITENNELIVSPGLRDVWQGTLPDPPQFTPVETNTDASPLWQALPQGEARVLAPPTALQTRERCAECGRPMAVALSTSPSDKMYGPDREIIYEDEARLTVDLAALPPGNLWTTDRLEGSVRHSMEVLQRYTEYPDPFFIRTARPFWLISRQMLRLLHEHAPRGWRAIPVNGAPPGE